MQTTPPGASVYFKRPPRPAETIDQYLGRELGIIERAIRDRRLKLQRAVTADHTLTADDEIVYVDATAAAVTITLPDARRFWGFAFTVKKVDASANVVTVDAGTSTVDGAGTYPLAAQYDAVRVVSDGTQWWVV